jgi:hypothetical protein
MASYLPPYLTSARRTVSAPGLRSSTTYDYSGSDEILKRKKEAGDLSAAYSDQLMNDPLASVSTGHRIRNLLSSLNEIAPVRIAGQSQDYDGPSESAELGGTHDEPKENRPAGSPSVVAGYKPPNRQNSGFRKKAMSNNIAGNPQGIGNDGRSLGNFYA